MPNSRLQTNAQDQEQRDKINRMDVTLSEVIQPALKSLQIDVKTIVQKDFLSRAEADNKYMTKSDFKPYAVAISTVGGIFLAAIAAALAHGIIK